MALDGSMKSIVPKYRVCQLVAIFSWKLPFPADSLGFLSGSEDTA